ncbi:LysR substrate-binding domain-containing protein [Allokutzneria oryzae]|uniref:LysR substrate-binding domain-containing protein n=1 Tax=Allokutzneria oryzae TaxID=1378989 RepID=A0ABV6A232_9PSEU
MSAVLDIVQLRSLVAIADHGGFHRAATALHLTQSAVSQHVARLAKVVGGELLERDGRQCRFTARGEQVLAEARSILSVHDHALRRLGIDHDAALVVGSTEHAADQLLPELAVALRAAFPQREIRFRLDRTARLAEAVEHGDVDLALLLGGPAGGRSRAAGTMRLTWFAAPKFVPKDPLPLVVYAEPCVVRRTAFAALGEDRVPFTVACEAQDLSGVLAAVRAGLGVTLLPVTARRPEGLAEFAGLPALRPAPLRVRVRRGAPVELGPITADVVREVLARHE